jgi:hypothetical protein
MIDLVNVVTGNGYLLHLGALLDEEQIPPETNIPADIPLALWHDGSPLFDRQNPRPIEGRISSVWPILIGARSYFVVAGEVEDEVWLTLQFSEPDQPPYSSERTQAVNVRGRNVWMSHPRTMHRRDAVTLTWPDGRSESIIIDPTA